MTVLTNEMKKELIQFFKAKLTFETSKRSESSGGLDGEAMYSSSCEVTVKLANTVIAKFSV